MSEKDLTIYDIKQAVADICNNPIDGWEKLMEANRRAEELINRVRQEQYARVWYRRLWAWVRMRMKLNAR
jgi:hypothetical protein